MRIRYEELPIEIIGYNPLELLSTSLITPEGIQYVRGDFNLNPGTIEKLKVSELKLLEKGKYKKYLQLILQGNSSNEEKWGASFIGHDSIGRTHLSVLIKEKPEQTYAELIAAFSMDKRVPFIVGLLMIEDYKSTHNGIEYIDSSGKYRECKIWHPQKTNIKPPINYRRILSNYRKDSKAMKNVFILATLKDYCYNKNITAQVLGIAISTLQNKLKEMEVINKYSVIDKQMADMILNNAIKSITGDSLIDLVRHQYGNMERVAPPAKAISHDTKLYTDISREKILNALTENNQNKAAAAAELNIPYPIFLQRIAMIAEQQNRTSEDPVDIPFFIEEQKILHFDPMQKINLSEDDYETDDIVF